MKYLYISDACSEREYNRLFSDSDNKPAIQSIKFNRLMAEGLVENNAEVVCLSRLPINKNTYNKIFYNRKYEVVNNVKYVYVPIISLSGINNIFVFIYTFFYICKFSIKNKDSVVLIDVLKTTIGKAASLVYKLTKKDSIGIVTDLPEYFEKSKKIIDSIIIDCKKYVFLTKSMDRVININNKPSIVIEGITDIKMKSQNNIIENKYGEKVIVYAGSFDRRFGILKLIKAFKLIDKKNIRLWIYGVGDSQNEIIEECKSDNRIYFGGMILNSEIVEIEKRATLLVNPRPSNERMTEFSFPSKTMEYMSTGTPVLTTKLKGIPSEYDPYLYYFEDESVEGMAKKIDEVISLPILKLNEKGLKARKFILDEKNNLIQTKKIINLINY